MIEYLEKENALLVHVNALDHPLIKAAIINQRGETIHKIQFPGGKHRIDLSILPDGDYAVRMEAGENVEVKKISVKKVSSF